MTPECEDEEFKAVPNQLGAPPDKECCDTETIRRIPDELREPEGELPTTEPEHAALPGPLEIWSRRVIANCEGEQVLGDSVELDAGYRKRNLYFSSVLSITQDVLTYIAESQVEHTLSNLYNDGELTAEKLRSLTGMTLVQARELLELADAVRDDLTAIAQGLAEAQLYCYWLNAEQIVECPDPAMAHPEDSPDAVFRVVIPAKRYASTLSQEDADRQAREAAEGMLNCFYMNDQFVALCEERPDRPEEVMDPVPNDAIPVYPGRALRVGRVEVPANKFKSASSKEEANRMAQDWGYAQLVCWYPNLEVTAQCDDPNARNMHVDPLTTSAADADIDKRTYGQRVRVPYGYFTSYLSVELATQEAEQLAESLLQCCYINRPLHLECSAEEVVMSDGTKAIIPYAPYPISPMPVIDVPAGRYYSCVSQEEADELAALSVEGLLDCRYCSLPVPPTCVPYDVIEATKLPEDDPRHIPLPLVDGNIGNDELGYYSAASFPMNATRGAQAAAVCDANAQAAQQVADLMAKLPITGTSEENYESCTYYNDRVFVACASYDPFTGEEVAAGELISGTDPDGNPYWFITAYPVGTCLYNAMTSPKPGNYIEAPAGMFSDQGADKKNELNSRAIEWARSLLQCWFTNPTTKAACYGFATEHGSLCASMWTISKHEIVDNPHAEYDPVALLTEWSNTKSRPVTIPQGQILVKGVESEREAADTIVGAAIDLAKSEVLCMFGNYGVFTDRCNNTNTYDDDIGGGGYIYGELNTVNQIYKTVNIGPMTFIAESVEEATLAAINAVDNASFCYTDDWIIYYEGSGGGMSDASSSSSDGGATPVPPISSPSLPSSCTITFSVEWNCGGECPHGSGHACYPTLTNIIVQETGQSLTEADVFIEGRGPYCECETAHITVYWPEGNGQGSYDDELPCHSSSSPASSDGTEGCYYNCPNYVDAQPASINLDKSIIESAQSDFMLWENDAAANYELLSAELANLERQIKILEAQL